MARPVSLREPQLITPLGAVGRGDLDTAGGKGANLGELVRGGFAVPDGFIVSTGAYAAVVEHAGLASRITACLASGGDGSAVRAALGALPVPEPLRAAIAGAYADLGGGPVAVRSSATAEDLPGAAFAGQHDTFFHVIGEKAVLAAVCRCWGSLWTERAIAYRGRLGLDSGQVRIAVIVQRMVAAEFAGVLFTANPVTGDRGDVVIDATSGLGEAVVSGLVTPDHYVLDPHGRIRERIEGGVRSSFTARRAVVSRTARRSRPSACPTTRAPRARDRRQGRRRAFRTAPGHRVGRRGREGAAGPGAPDDSALPPPPLRLNRIQRIYGPQIAEMLSVRPYPLDMASWTLLGPGRMVAEIPGLRVDFAAMLPETDGVVDRFVPPVPRPTLALLTAPARNLPRIRRHDPAAWTGDARFARFQRAVAELAALDPGGLGWAELVCLPRRALAVWNRSPICGSTTCRGREPPCCGCA